MPKRQPAQNLPYGHCTHCTGKADDQDAYNVTVGHVVSYTREIRQEFTLCAECFTALFPWKLDI